MGQSVNSQQVRLHWQTFSEMGTINALSSFKTQRLSAKTRRLKVNDPQHAKPRYIVGSDIEAALH